MTGVQTCALPILKLLVDHRDDLVDERRRIQQRLRWHLHQLDPTLADPNRGRAHTLAVHGGLMFHLGAEQPRIRGERLVEVVNRNAEVMDSLRLHGSEATARTEPPDLPSDQSRSVSQAQPAYAQADSCGAATRSLAAPHG